MNYQIDLCDVMKWEYTGQPFQGLICDAPYHLTSIVDRFGDENAAPAKGDVYNRVAKGFMGQTWDGGDLAFTPELWLHLAKYLSFDAYVAVYAASRNWHLVAYALETAGFTIAKILGWVYGNGFKKSTRIDRLIDSRAGYDLPPVRKYKPITNAAKQWGNHQYGLQALKPALEPIIIARRIVNPVIEQRLSKATVSYVTKPTTDEKNEGLGGETNPHPTCKPITLNEWLGRLLLPSNQRPRLLNPFSGTGSEAIGAIRAGWFHAQLIEITPEYCDIASKRLAHWLTKGIQESLF